MVPQTVEPPVTQGTPPAHDNTDSQPARPVRLSDDGVAHKLRSVVDAHAVRLRPRSERAGVAAAVARAEVGPRRGVLGDPVEGDEARVGGAGQALAQDVDAVVCSLPIAGGVVSRWCAAYPGGRRGGGSPMCTRQYSGSCW